MGNLNKELNMTHVRLYFIISEITPSCLVGSVLSSK